jgi:hypothetical protein
MKKAFLILSLLSFSILFFLNSCSTEDLKNENKTDLISTSIYNDDISNYLNHLKTQSNKENSLKIEALANAIDFNSVKIYDLKTTEKLVVVDLKSLKGFETSDKTKVIFFVYENKITHSNIITFNVKVPFDNLDKVILSVLDIKKNKDNYTGKISFYNLFQNIWLSNEFEGGKLTVNGIARRETTKRITGKSAGCTAWYWVTTYASGYQRWEYLYTTCTCEEQTWRMADTITCNSGGGSSSTSGAAYPPTPQNTDLFTYIDQDGQIITKKYNGETQTWEFFSISLSEVIVNNNPTKYSYLIFEWPKDQQKVVNADIIYTYDGASGNWGGVPVTDELIEQAIEDNIDDTKLDPCPKGVMEQLKNATNCDIANILTKLGANTLYNVKIVSGDSGIFPAGTARISKNNYEITLSSDRFTSSTQLFKASILLHELGHAFFMSLIDDYSISQNPAVFSEFPTLFQKYVDTKYPGGKQDAHHEEMANTYVDAIGAALQEFQTGTAVPFGTKPNQIYTDLAWGGLRDAPIYGEKFPSGTPERLRIDNRLACEQSGSPVGYGTPQQQNTIGKPCN